MPIPLIPVLALSALASSLTLVYFWPQIKKKLLGKKLLMIGQEESGKTTLAHLLTHDELPQDKNRTITSKWFEFVEFKNLHLKIRTLDTPGQEESKEVKWKDAFADCDYVFYLIRADLFLKNDLIHIKRVERDMRSIKQWLNGEIKPIVVVATHEDFVNNQDDDVYTRLSGCEAYRKAVNILDPRCKKELVVGSLESIEKGRDLVSKALRALLKQ